MKLRILLLSCLLALPASLRAQEKADPRYSREYLEREIEGYRMMQGFGYAGMGLGGVLIVAGAVISSTAGGSNEVDEYGDRVEETDVGQEVLGIITVIGGVTFLATGAVFSSIGSGNRAKYERMLKALSFKPVLRPERQGAVLSLRF